MAAGVNRPDVAQRAGSYPPPPGASDIPGLEIAGEVVALGEAPRWKLGDKVMALVAAAATPNTALRTTRRRCRCRLALDPGSRRDPGNVLHRLAQRVRARRAEAGRDLLIHGGSSGIGTTAIQLAKAFGAKVIVTAGSQDKMRRLPQARRRPSPSTTRPRTSSPPSRRRPAARAPTSSSTWSAATISSATMTPPRSTAASCRSPSGSPKPPSTFRRIMVKRLTHTGSTLRPRSIADKAAIAAAIEAKVCRYCATDGQTGDGQLIPAGKSRRRAPAHGDQRTYWQNRAGGL